MTRSTVYRYRLGEHLGLQADEQLVVPSGARVLSVQRRDGAADAVDVWAEVDPEQSDATIRILLVGTGWSGVPQPPARYVGTVQLASGGLVLHAYVLGDASEAEVAEALEAAPDA